MNKIDPQLRARIISDLMEDINRGVRKKTSVDMSDEQTITLAEVHLEFLIEIVTDNRDRFREESPVLHENIFKERLVKPLVGQGLTEANATGLIDHLFTQT